ncbi:MAG TPA: acetoacetate--CoA ligase [Rhizobiaceae bacterium]|nr:acetoacetate--CoA ligase [Rhizobiaceae bacterium]
MISEAALFVPSLEQMQSSRMKAFMGWLENRTGRRFEDYGSLHGWSVAEPEAFWEAIWDFCGVIGEKGGRIAEYLDQMPGARFFPQARLNFAENLLERQGAPDAMVFRAEDKVSRRLSRDDLSVLVSRLQQALANAGVGKGDRVAAMIANMPEAIAFMLATASLGAIFSSCSPDFGVQGVLDRFGQIEPKVFVACDGYWYGGKEIDIGPKLVEIASALGAARTVVVPLLQRATQTAASIENGVALEDFIARFPARPVEYRQVEFNHPLYILFSSGTTGVPKCIVHSQGGTLLAHLKEQQLHSNLSSGDRLFYFSTCGWMMWNWLASGLASGCTLMLYDGSPFHPDGNVLFDYCQQERINFFGTSAKFIDAVRKSGLEPALTHDLSSVATIASTGSPLAPENFDFVYASVKQDVHLASISGGTDIVGCFVLGNPLMPVWKGEIQCAGLGLSVEVWNEDGQPVTGEKGELVCTRPFPNMPVMFWNDPDGGKYRSAYFERFDNVWRHGDFAEWTPHGGMIIHGRSDATLNPGGVRIGTAEIYNQVEQLEEIAEALCIGQDWQGDVRVVLFVRLAPGVVLDEALIAKVKAKIRTGASPRHVPAKIIAVIDIPRTKSGKITELAVRDIVHGRSVKNREALANPEALALFENIAELSTA